MAASKAQKSNVRTPAALFNLFKNRPNRRGGNEVRHGNYDFLMIVSTNCLSMMVITFMFTVIDHNVRPVQRYFKSTAGITLTHLSAWGLLFLVLIMFLLKFGHRAPFNRLTLFFTLIFMSTVTAHVADATPSTVLISILFVRIATLVFYMFLAGAGVDLQRLCIYFITFLFVSCVCIATILFNRFVFNVHFTDQQIVALVLLSYLLCALMVLEIVLILRNTMIILGPKDYAMGTFMLYTNFITPPIKVLLLLLHRFRR